MSIFKKTYHSKWFPRLFYKKYDGGRDSGVVGYFLIEWKPVFSVGILRFSKGSREAFHSHAFNAFTWFLKGSVTEDRLNGPIREFTPSFKPKYTPRTNLHRVIGNEVTYALTFRGPWEDTWMEYKNGEFVTLTHGRKVINDE